MIMRISALVVALGLLPGSKAVTTVSVGSCADFRVAAASTAADDVVAELSVEEISCSSWTTLEVTNNRLKIVAGGELTNDDGFFFHNVRFEVSSVLRFEFHAHFSGDTPEDGETSSHEVNGGILKVASGARARFMSDVYVEYITISSGTNDASAITSDAGHGGCFYNEGLIRFEKTVETYGCLTSGGGDVGAGDGGTLWNGASGQVVMKGEVNMHDSGIERPDVELYGTLRGGAIYNEGKISCFSNTAFSGSQANMGGGIYNSGTIKSLTGTDNFSGNRAAGDGGQFYNSGTVLLKGGASFYNGYTELGSGGGIFNSGSFIILGNNFPTTSGVEFVENASATGGGAITSTSDATLEIPNNTVFDGNYLVYNDNDGYCDDICIDPGMGGACTCLD